LAPPPLSAPAKRFPVGPTRRDTPGRSFLLFFSTTTDDTGRRTPSAACSFLDFFCPFHPCRQSLTLPATGPLIGTLLSCYFFSFSSARPSPRFIQGIFWPSSCCSFFIFRYTPPPSPPATSGHIFSQHSKRAFTSISRRFLQFFHFSTGLKVWFGVCQPCTPFFKPFFQTLHPLPHFFGMVWLGPVRFDAAFLSHSFLFPLFGRFTQKPKTLSPLWAKLRTFLSLISFALTLFDRFLFPCSQRY